MSALPILDWDQAYNRSGDGKLPRTVVNALRTYMDNETLTGWVKAETLAEDTGLKIRAVREQISKNVAAGWLEIAERGNSSGRANVYQLTYPGEKGAADCTIGSTQQRVQQNAPLTGNGAAERTEGCSRVHPKGASDCSPTTPRTSPRTSPQEKFLERTTPQTVQSGAPFGAPAITASGGSAMEAEPDTAEGPEKAPPAESTDQVGASARGASPSHDRARGAGSDSTSTAATADRRSVRRDRPRPVGRDPFAEAPPARFDDEPPW